METWTGPDSFDALAAAPAYHRLLFENDEVRVLDTRVESNETVPLHTHRWPGFAYVISTGDFVRRDAEGTVVVDTRTTGTVLEPGSAVWLPALPPHSLENVSSSEIRAIHVERKR